MKNKKYFLPILFIVPSLFISFNNSENTETRVSEIILQGSDFIVSNSKPLDFILYLNEDDIFSVELSRLRGKAKMEDLLIRLVDLNQLNEYEVASISEKTDWKSDPISNTGKYRLEISTSSRKEMNCDILMTRRTFYNTKKVQQLSLLETTSIRIGDISDKKTDKPRLIVNLKKGDKLMISSTDYEGANIIRYKVTPTGEEYNINKGEVPIVKDGQYKIEFYALWDNISWLQWKKKFGQAFTKRKFVLKNLSIKRVRLPSINSSNPNINNSNPTIDPNIEARNRTMEFAEKLSQQTQVNTQKMQEQNYQRQQDMTIALNNMQERSQASTEKMIESMTDMIKAVMKKDTNKIAIPGAVIEKSITVTAQENLLYQNKKCILLEGLDDPDNQQFWVYWLGTGKKARQVYEQQDATTKITYKGRGITEVLSNKVLKNKTDKINLLFPNPNDKKNEGLLEEGIEFIVVDKMGEQNYLNGATDYTALDNIEARYTNANFGIGYPRKEDMYLCMCNRNNVTPVDVYLRYQAVSVDYEIN